MHLVLVGLSHHEAPIDVRERLNCAPHALSAALQHLLTLPNVREGVVLSTCNRMEVYAVVEGQRVEDAYRALTHHLAGFHQVPESLFGARLFHRAEGEAASHLLRVAGGLDSLVLGEPQILGQVREAMSVAQAAQSCGPVLSKLFGQALATGKRVRSETGLGRGGFSIGHAAVSLAQRILDDFSRARVLILGAGKMSYVTAAHLKRSGVQFVVVANRTHDKAVALAERLGGQAIHYDSFLDEMTRADIVIASTSAPHPIVRRAMLAPVMKKRRGKPLFLIDIALPRDIDPDVNELDNVYLRNIDDLQEIVEQQAQGRAGEIGAAERIVLEETSAFVAWLKARGAVPVIAQLRSHLDAMTKARLDILRARLGPLNDRQWQEIETQFRAHNDQVALAPTRRLKRAASETNGTDGGTEYDLMEATRELFGLQAEEGGEAKDTVQSVMPSLPSPTADVSGHEEPPRSGGFAFAPAAPVEVTGKPARHNERTP